MALSGVYESIRYKLLEMIRAGTKGVALDGMVLIVSGANLGASCPPRANLLNVFQT